MLALCHSRGPAPCGCRSRAPRRTRTCAAASTSFVEQGSSRRDKHRSRLYNGKPLTRLLCIGKLTGCGRVFCALSTLAIVLAQFDAKCAFRYVCCAQPLGLCEVAQGGGGVRCKVADCHRYVRASINQASSSFQSSCIVPWKPLTNDPALIRSGDGRTLIVDLVSVVHVADRCSEPPAGGSPSID